MNEIKSNITNEIMDKTVFRLEPYNDAEVPAAIAELFGNQTFLNGMEAFLPSDLNKKILENIKEVNTVKDFQKKIVHPFFKSVEAMSIRQLSVEGLEHLNTDDKYLFISNHRDIVLDSAFLNIVLFEHDISTSQIAIGDNLMVHRMSELLFRLNKSFVVKRSGTPRELYGYSVQMSNYIRDLLTQKQDSVWIAQREGRAKDGNDKTQVGLLKMLSLAGKKNFKAHLKALKIVPVSISYEYDPCDILKTQEYLKKQADKNYKKPFQEDIKHILQGLQGLKGQVHFSFGKPLNEELDGFDDLTNHKKQLEFLATLIDKSIHCNYKIKSINYIAHDLLMTKDTYKNVYSAAEFEEYSTFFNQKLQCLKPDELETGRAYLLGIYANPLINAMAY